MVEAEEEGEGVEVVAGEAAAGGVEAVVVVVVVGVS